MFGSIFAISFYVFVIKFHNMLVHFSFYFIMNDFLMKNNVWFSSWVSSMLVLINWKMKVEKILQKRVTIRQQLTNWIQRTIQVLSLLHGLTLTQCLRDYSLAECFCYAEDICTRTLAHRKIDLKMYNSGLFIYYVFRINRSYIECKQLSTF